MNDKSPESSQDKFREGEAPAEPRSGDTHRVNCSAGASPSRMFQSDVAATNVQAYHVEWFVTDRARHDVTVRIRDGRLLGTEKGCAPDAIELGSVALVDGLVNAHTHLEFSGLTQPIPTTGRFTDWIRAVIQHRREHPHSVSEAIRSGFRESVQSGTTLVGDIATVGWSDRDYSEAPIPSVIFQEILGLSPERIAGQKDVAQSHVSQANLKRESPDSSFVTDGPARGISPHAPYSTHRDLVHEAVRLARQGGYRVAMHIAETTAEVELLETGQGEFRELLTGLGLWRAELFHGKATPMDYLQILAQAPGALVIHGNYLNDDELRFLASQPNMTLVYCPRTHAAFGHIDHPWRRLLELGGHVAIGTDSRASNPDLSLFAELQFLAAKHPEVSHLELLRLASTEGHRALGFNGNDEANFTLIRLSESGARPPEEALFTPDNTVCGTMIAGHWAWLADDLPVM